MISCDTNVLYAALYDDGSERHGKALAFLEPWMESREFILCEQVLMEFYCLLRNPALHRHPLLPEEAGAVIQTLRSNPFWRIVDVPESAAVMQKVWKRAGTSPFACRRIFDLRLAGTLLHYGVDTFATRNVKDFADAGFQTLIDPFL